MTEAVQSAGAVIHNLFSCGMSKIKLEPTILAQVEVNGTPTDALVDGSPVTIVS